MFVISFVMTTTEELGVAQLLALMLVLNCLSNVFHFEIVEELLETLATLGPRPLRHPPPTWRGI